MLQETFKARLDSFQAQTKPMIDYFAEQGGANQQPVYVRLQGTSSNEIWPRMLKVVKDRFPTAVKE
jgi:nucleoside-triphosphate--adenylate kinase